MDPKTENFTAPGPAESTNRDVGVEPLVADYALANRDYFRSFSVARIRTLQFRLRSTDTTGYVRILEIPAGGLISGIIVTGETGLKVHNPKRILRDAVDRGWIQFPCQFETDCRHRNENTFRLLQDYA